MKKRTVLAVVATGLLIGAGAFWAYYQRRLHPALETSRPSAGGPSVPSTEKGAGERIKERAARFLEIKPRIGDLAPDFTAVDEGGKKLRLSDLRGRYVVLQFGCVT